ncbi:hypothetical protein [Dactylosporangium sp. NPDC049140]|jgi:hypothetical protein|uniref:hypothetical protein n=1 Tax=Dactylosporangium sp. NPDC049140 TaxID=3155647 RepID=UPI00340DC696
MSDFDLDWGMEHDLHVDHDGGVEHVLAGDHGYDAHEHHDAYNDGHEHHEYAGDADHDTVVDADAQHDDAPTLDEQDIDLPDWQLDTDFLDGHYDLVGADPDENDMWSQLMSDMHEEVNPYAAN